MTKANYCCHFIKGIRLAGAEKALTGMCGKKQLEIGSRIKEQAGSLETVMYEKGRREEGEAREEERRRRGERGIL